MGYEEILADLRLAYDRRADELDAAPLAEWQRQERDRLLALLRNEGVRTVLVVGAGPGSDARFLSDQGLDVLCTDLSREMVRRCQEKGLRAYVMDPLHLELPPESFDAVCAVNSLAHVPRAHLPQALAAVSFLLKPGGIFYWGQEGGVEEEGVRRDDRYEPKRFFSTLTDEQIQQAAAAAAFEVVAFRAVETGAPPPRHFQALTLRKPG